MREVLRGAMVTFPLRALGAGIAFSFNIVLGRLFGAEDAGLYFLALTIATICYTLGNLGLEGVLLRHAASNSSPDRKGEIQTIAAIGMRVSLIFALILTVLLVIAAPWIAEVILKNPDLTRPLQWMALTIVPQTQLRLYAQLLRGFKKIALSQTLRNIDVPLMTIIFIAILGVSFGVTGAVWAFALASTLTFIFAIIIWKRVLKPESQVTHTITTRELIRSGFPLLQTNLMNLMLNPATIMLLGALADATAVAIFAIAFRTAMLTRFSLMAVNAIAAPKFAALHSSKEDKALASTSRRSTFLITFAATPMLVIFMVFPEWVMSLFGEEFVAGAQVLMILSAGQFFAVICGSVGYLLMMSGNEKLLRNNTLISGITCLILNLLLIPDYGVIGAAVAVSSSIILRSLLGSIQVYRQLGILPFFIQSPMGNSNDE